MLTLKAVMQKEAYMELTLSLDTGMVCGKCGRELNKDAVIYYSDKSCDVYCCQCGEGKYTHIAGRRVIKYVRTPDGFHPALTPEALDTLENDIYYAKPFGKTEGKLIYRSSGLCEIDCNKSLDETIIECTDYKALILFSVNDCFPLYDDDDNEYNLACHLATLMYKLSEDGKQSLLVDERDCVVGIISTKCVAADRDGLAADMSLYRLVDDPYETEDPSPQCEAKEQICTAPADAESILLRETVNDDFAREMLNYVLSRIKGQDNEIRRAVYIVYEYLKSIASGKPMHSVSWIITAPSGSGKTEFYRSIRDFFKAKKIPVPVIQYDMSRITETGFKGAESSEILKLAYKVNGTSGYAIFFLDEADKRFIPSYSGNGQDANRAVQAELLTMVEGTIRSIDENEPSTTFDTNKTMFVFMGAFQDLRERKAVRTAVRSTPIGFTDGSKNASPESGQYVDYFYSDLSIEDMIEYGMLEELAGRITRVVNFHLIEESEMRKLIKLKAEEISKEAGVITEFSRNAYDELFEQAYTNLGVRRPMNIIRGCIQDALAKIVFDKSSAENDEYIIRIDSVYEQPKIKRSSGRKIPSVKPCAKKSAGGWAKNTNGVKVHKP